MEVSRGGIKKIEGEGLQREADGATGQVEERYSANSLPEFV